MGIDAVEHSCRTLDLLQHPKMVNKKVVERALRSVRLMGQKD